MRRSVNDLTSKPMAMEDNRNHVELLAKVKKDVRSLLMSAKLGLDPDQLRRDYVTMLGHPMPLKQLGFRNVMDMVQEMPDVVSVHYRPDGSFYLKAISDENTQNIEELVARQRLSRSDKIKNIRSTRYDRPSFTPLPRRGHVPPALPANLKTQLRILLSEGSLRLSDLEACYLRYFGHPINIHNYGYYSVGEMVAAAKDMIVINQGRLGSVLSLREHLMPRLGMKWNNPPRTGPDNPSSFSSYSPSFKNSDTKIPAKTKPSVVFVKQGPLKPPAKEVSESSRHLVMSDKSCDVKQAPWEDGGLFCQNVIKHEKELHHQILEYSVAGTVSQELKDKLRKVVGETTDGLSVHDLSAEYKRVYGEDLPFQQSGFLSVTELVGALSDIFHLKPTEDNRGNSWIVVDLRDRDKTQPGTDRARMSPKSHYFSLRECQWEEKSKDIASSDENDELESEVSSIHEMMPEIYPVIQVHPRSSVPLDAMLNQRLKPPTRRQARELIQVLVEQVETPGSFYIRFSETEEACALETLMFDMRRCYTCPEVSEEYHLPQPFVRQGQVCCVSPNRLWFYRVVIHRIVNSSDVEVFYADFGDVALVPVQDLKFLKSSFSELPAQAVPSALTGIKPTSDTWTAESTDSFKKLCSDHTLVGALDCYTGDVLQLYLCDTHTDQDIYIHTALINQGHGIACRPATPTTVCMKVTPVSLYMGEGMVELPEIDEELIASLKSGENFGQSKETPVKDDDEEMPALELIEESEFIPHIKGDADKVMPPLELIEESESIPHVEAKDPDPSCGILPDQNVGCSEKALASADESTLKADASLAPPGLFQTKNSASCKTETKALHITSTPTPPSSDSTTCWSQEEMTQTMKVKTSFIGPSLIYKTLNQGCSKGTPVSPLFLRKSSIQFPLFGTR
ncbi:tudor domain-containing protein 5 [Cyprinodon tularosa]|uniref:tudor domain-containing protein 5 n=1 Tax=Cyprinodon tularosa TaxID=77115 RepID=UPI0018E27192|nr:tudor domain-containing protein 5 [Cyprinodon tularosa]